MRCLVIAAVATVGLACSKVDNQHPRAAEQGTTMADKAGRVDPAASVTLSPLAQSGVSGELAFFPTDGGVRVEGYVKGLTPNRTHGFHIHDRGDCTAPDGSSAGDHYNPTQAQHGAPGPASHVGDMGNIVSDADGLASVSAFIVGGSIGAIGQVEHARGNIVGRAVIVHAKADDLASQPAGNAGARISCGVILRR